MKIISKVNKLKSIEGKIVFHRILGAILFLAIVSFIALYLWDEFPELSSQSAIASNLGFFLLINVNIIVVMILVFLVARNLIKLFLDRKRNILGARLRTKLVTAFVGLSLIPTVMLFLVAKGILESVLFSWFSPQIVATVDGALSITQYYSDASASQLKAQSELLAIKLKDKTLELGQPNVDPNSFKQYVDAQREVLGLYLIKLFNEQGEEVIVSSADETQTVIFAPLKVDPFGFVKKNSILVDKLSNGELLTAFYVFDTIDNQVHDTKKYIVSVSKLIPSDLASKLSGVINSYDDYQELKSFRRPLASSYLLTLVVVTLLIVFAAISVGFYLARNLTVPISFLANATSEVAHGNLDYQIPEVGDDELSILVKSFNTMTADLKRTTRAAAWREVAKRIAHEIKNPLTPIQLCAERMYRRFSSGQLSTVNADDKNLVVECSDIIIKQVESLRVLVNEFSRFAQMPRVQLKKAALNPIVSENMAIFIEAHSDINFEMDLANNLPELELDKEQIARVIINLIDNSIASVKTVAEEMLQKKSFYQPKITVITKFDPELELITLSVADNGTGVKEEDKPKLFEPYFSSKENGTGLGLAIVSSIVSDHSGFIRIKDNRPTGAIFVMELPVKN